MKAKKKNKVRHASAAPATTPKSTSPKMATPGDISTSPAIPDDGAFDKFGGPGQQLGKLNKKQRMALAQETLATLRDGHYSVLGEQVSIKAALEASVRRTVFISPQQQLRALEAKPTSRVALLDSYTLTAAESLRRVLPAGTKIGVLNFGE